MKPSAMLPWVVVGILTLLCVTLIVMYTIQSKELDRYKNNAGTQTSQPSATSSADASDQDEQLRQLLRSLPRREANDPAALGKVDAPVVLIEWSDYTCPFCAAFATGTHPALMQYVEDGSLRIERREMPVLGEGGVMAARAGVAAGLQGKYWEFYTAVYEAAPQNGHLEVTKDALMTFAKQAGVPDLEKFASDMDSDQVKQKVQRDFQEGQSLGISSVPFFVINDTVLSGARGTGEFVSTIQSYLKNR